MTNEDLKKIISERVGEVEFMEENYTYLTAKVPKDKLRDLLIYLKEDSSTAFDYMFSITGVDWKKSFGVIYHLESTKHRHIIALHVYTEDRENNITLDTVSDIYPTADFNEREIYDLFGVKFEGHPDLRRLLLDDTWSGHPLRKDYVDEARMIVK